MLIRLGRYIELKNLKIYVTVMLQSMFHINSISCSQVQLNLKITERFEDT